MGAREMAPVIVGCGCFCFIAFWILFGFWINEAGNEEHYVMGSCSVVSHTVLTETCSSRSCTGSGKSKSCRTSYYTCYRLSTRVTWLTKNEIPRESTIRTSTSRSSDYNEEERKHPVGTQQECWYDTREDNEEDVQWDQPDAEGLMIASIVIGCLAAIFCCIPVTAFASSMIVETIRGKW